MSVYNVSLGLQNFGYYNKNRSDGETKISQSDNQMVSSRARLSKPLQMEVKVGEL